MDGCSNMEDDKCRYFEALIGTGEEPPSGMDTSNGDCLAREAVASWLDIDPQDCDMLDLE